MNTEVDTSSQPDTGTGAEQLTLLPDSDVHARFRLSKATRERGLRHIAEIRQMLAERQQAEESSNVHRLPPRRRHHDAA